MPKSTLWPRYYDVVILPPTDVRDHAIALSRQLQKYGAKFVLGRREYIPHISLYHIPVKPKDFDEFATAVEGVAQSHSGGVLKLRKIEMPVLMTDKPEWLKRLHRDVVKHTSRFFDWDYGVEDLWSFDYMPARLKTRAKGHLKKYGSPLIGAAFRPHITLTSFVDKGIVPEIPLPKVEPLVFDVMEITICELGPSHSCQKIAYTFRLA